ADAVLVDLEDLWLEDRPQNRPVTGVEGHNWRRRAALSLTQIRSDGEVRRRLRAVDDGRRMVPSGGPDRAPAGAISRPRLTETSR
ncbi:MAG: hypothetical protein ACRDY1_00955, partial [Acidimicrobiales bacterium]